MAVSTDWNVVDVYDDNLSVTLRSIRPELTGLGARHASGIESAWHISAFSDRFSCWNTSAKNKFTHTRLSLPHHRVKDID